MNRETSSRVLAGIGFELVQFVGIEGAPPLGAVWMLSSCPASEGRIDREVSLDDPEIAVKFNAMWVRMAAEFELFGEYGEFLLAARGDASSGDPYAHWVKVRLMDSWDIFPAGAGEHLTGYEEGYPEFAMSSLDGRTILRGTTWSTTAGCIVMREPYRSATLRRHVSGPYLQFDIGPAERRAAEAWLRLADAADHEL